MADFDSQQPVRAIATQFTTEVANAAGTTINPAEDFSQGSTTSGQSGVLSQAAVTTASPAYTTGTTNPLSLDTSGNLRVTLSASSAEQNVNLNQVGGSAIALGQTTMANSLPVVLASNQSAIPVTLTSTTITGTVAVTQSTSPWVVSLASTTITGTVTAVGNLTHNNAAPAANNIGVLPAIASTAAPTYTTGDQVLLSTDLAGNLRVTLAASSAEQNVNLNQVGGSAIALGQTTMSASLPVTIASNQTALPVTLTSTTITGTVAVTQSTSPWVVSGTVTANAGTGNFATNLAQVNGSTVVTATTGVQKVGISDSAGSSITIGQKTMSNSVPVTFASDQTPLNVQIGGVTPVVTYATTTSVASNASATQSVAGPINLDVVHCSASGEIKVVVAIGTTGSEVTKWVGFTTASSKNFDWVLPDTYNIPVGSSVKITITNLDKQSMDVYSSVTNH